jgi:hypothetical protein
MNLGRKELSHHMSIVRVDSNKGYSKNLGLMVALSDLDWEL